MDGRDAGAGDGLHGEPQAGLQGDSGDAVERRNVTRLIRVLAVFVLVPTVTIGGVMLWDPGTRSEHWLHAGGFAVLAMAAFLAFAQAPRLAQRFVKSS